MASRNLNFKELSTNSTLNYDEAIQEGYYDGLGKPLAIDATILKAMKQQGFKDTTEHYYSDKDVMKPNNVYALQRFASFYHIPGFYNVLGKSVKLQARYLQLFNAMTNAVYQKPKVEQEQKTSQTTEQEQKTSQTTEQEQKTSQTTEQEQKTNQSTEQEQPPHQTTMQEQKMTPTVQTTTGSEQISAGNTEQQSVSSSSSASNDFMAMVDFGTPSSTESVVPKTMVSSVFDSDVQGSQSSGIDSLTDAADKDEADARKMDMIRAQIQDKKEGGHRDDSDNIDHSVSQSQSSQTEHTHQESVSVSQSVSTTSSKETAVVDTDNDFDIFDSLEASYAATLAPVDSDGAVDSKVDNDYETAQSVMAEQSINAMIDVLRKKAVKEGLLNSVPEAWQQEAAVKVMPSQSQPTSGQSVHSKHQSASKAILDSASESKTFQLFEPEQKTTPIDSSMTGSEQKSAGSAMEQLINSSQAAVRLPGTETPLTQSQLDRQSLDLDEPDLQTAPKKQTGQIPNKILFKELPQPIQYGPIFAKYHVDTTIQSMITAKLYGFIYNASVRAFQAGLNDSQKVLFEKIANSDRVNTILLYLLVQSNAMTWLQWVYAMNLTGLSRASGHKGSQLVDEIRACKTMREVINLKRLNNTERWYFEMATVDPLKHRTTDAASENRRMDRIEDKLDMIRMGQMVDWQHPGEKHAAEDLFELFSDPETSNMLAEMVHNDPELTKRLRTMRRTEAARRRK